MKSMISVLLAVSLLLCPIMGLSSFAQSEQNGKSKKVALTFDDGPDERYTEKILDILEKYNIKATFFVVGSNVCKYPQILKREANEGHEIGNHTFTHPHLSKIEQTALVEEINKTASVVKTVCGKEITLFRPPEGVCTDSVQAVEQMLGYKQVLWNVDTRDWAGTDTASIVKTVKNSVKDGSVILFHDYIAGQSHTVEALEVIIPYLIDEGYIFVTVSEL